MRPTRASREPRHDGAVGWAHRAGLLLLMGAFACDSGAVVRVSMDATPRADAGFEADADVATDAGAAFDAALFPDAATDAGFQADAAAAPDASMDAGAPDAEPTPDASSPPLDALDDLRLYVNLGDSVGEGYNADRTRGYYDLVCQNHAAYPTYAQDNLRTRVPTIACQQGADSGSTSVDVAERARNLPDPAGTGDTLVTIYVGGNDFNDDITTIISSAATQAAIDRWVLNMTEVMTRLRARYEVAATGRQLLVVLATIHDPTDGMGTIPPQFTNGFCGTLQNPLLTPALRQRALMNLSSFNDAIRAFAARERALVLDSGTLFLGHGMNATTDRWLDADCIHGTNLGHHEIRREIWRILTGVSR